MKANVIFVTLLLIGCTSAAPGPGTRRVPRLAAISALEMLPPAYFWRGVGLANGLDLTDAQVAELEKAYVTGQSETDALERDRAIAARDLRAILQAAHPSSADITAAGQRFRVLDDKVYEHQLRMLAAVREVLSREQWEQLQRNLTTDREPMRERGGFGGGRRGGRRPGWEDHKGR